jgi:hypothetical protein
MQKPTPTQRVERFRDELLEELERLCAAHDHREYELVVEEIGKDEISLLWQVTRRRRVQADIRFDRRLGRVGCVVYDPVRSSLLGARPAESVENPTDAAGWVYSRATQWPQPR